MKFPALILSILCLASLAQAQDQQHLDSVPSPVRGWVQANTGSIQFESETYILFNSLPNPDTAWGYSGPNIRSFNTNLLDWSVAPLQNTEPFFFTGSYGIALGRNNTVFRTTNAGTTWDTFYAGPGLFGEGCFVSSSTFFLAQDGVARTRDSGRTWDVKQNVGSANAIAFGPEYLDIRKGWGRWTGYIATGQLDNGSAVFKTTDGGDTWQKHYTGIQTDLWGVQAIDTAKVLVISLGSVSRSTDGGQSWKTVESNLVGKNVLIGIAMQGAHGYAVGSGGSIIATSDSGLTWYVQNSGTKNDLYSVAMYDSSHAIIGGVKGTILVTRNGGVSWVAPPSVQDSLMVQVFPNPSSDQAQISYTLKKPSHVTLTIYDVRGQVVATPLHAVYQGGPETVPLNTASLAAGSYLYRLQSETYNTQGTFDVIH